MNNIWTEARIQQYIDDEIQETLTLDYKSADSLSKSDGKKREVTKDVSAMANSAGGIIIYGVKEFDKPDKEHLPEKITPVDQTKFTKEWLQQVINNIQPRVNDVVITPVPLSSGSTHHVVYVVEIPQSNIAHQAADKRYYKRHNTISEMMEHYEIMDVMARSKHPIVSLSFAVSERRISFLRSTRHVDLLIEATNTGQVLAKYVNCTVYLPSSFASRKTSLFDDNNVEIDGLKYYRLEKKNTRRDDLRTGENIVTEGMSWFDPLLPTRKHRWWWKLPSSFNKVNLNKNEKIIWEVYADNALKQHGETPLNNIEHLVEQETLYKLYEISSWSLRVGFPLYIAAIIFFVWLSWELSTGIIKATITGIQQALGW